MRTSKFISYPIIALSIVAALGWTAGAVADTGSIISSFRLSGYADPYASGLYPGDNYLSAIFVTSGQDYLYRYQYNGTYVRSYNLNGTGTPRGGDLAHLGNAYFSVVDSETSRLYVFRARGGNAITSFSVTAPSGGTLQDVMWTGTYYEVTDHWSTGRFNRYTTAGSLVGSVTYAGWPGAMATTGAAAFSDVAFGSSGSYMVASARTNGQPSCIIDVSGSGSLVATFSMPPYFASGACCGRSSKPALYGTAYWAAWITADSIWCYEVDIDGLVGSAVTPASVGEIRALYR
ncbi:MAG: hypothetical protein PVH29_13880 [Candidatus Zixiibacteriota bacterium]